MEIQRILFNFGIFLTKTSKLKKMNKENLVTCLIVVVSVIVAIAVDKKFGISAKISGK